MKAGQYCLFAGRYEDARKIAERILDRDVRNVDAQLLLANALAGLDDFDAAARQVEESIRAEPSNATNYTNLAAVELARDNPAKAEQAFRNALTIAPSSIEARVGLANLYIATGRMVDAEKLLKEATAIDPRHMLANRTLAALYLVSGRPELAEAPLKAVAAGNPDFLAPQLALADYYLATRRTDEGLRLLDAVANREDGYSPAMLRMAQYEFAAGKRPAAYARVEKVVAADPKNPQPLLVKAAFLLTEGQADQALAAAKGAVALAPRLGRAHFAVGSIELARGQLTSARAAFQEALRVSPGFGPSALEIARIDLSQGQADTAVQFADEAVRKLPQSADARYVLVRALLARGDRERASLEMKPLQTHYGAVPRVQTLVGRLALTQQDREAARRAFEQALKAGPTDDDALAGLIELDLQAGRKAEALQRVEARLKLTPKNPAALTIAGRLFMTLGLQARAEDAWKAVAVVDSGNLEAYAALGRIYYQQKRLDQALAEAERLVRQEPKSAMAHTLVGFLLEALGRTAEAQKSYQAALEADPRSPAAANNLAWLLATSGGNLEEALRLAQLAKAALPNSPEVNDTLGWVYYKKGMRGMAVGPLEQAVRAMPERATYRFHLGMAYLGSNEWVQARTALQEALRLDPNFDGAAEARKALAAIQ
jgi:tetratricopeptide (TPR) repeat protein